MTDSGYIIGVDPGLSGAIAILDTEGQLVYLRDMPTRKDCSKNTVDILALASDEDLLKVLLRNGPKVAIERVQAMGVGDRGTGIGLSAAVGMGKSSGKIEGFFEAQSFLPKMVVPAVWKRFHGLLKQDKKASVYLARQYWPYWADQFLISKDGRAEAALIAAWMRDNFKAQ